MDAVERVAAAVASLGGAGGISAGLIETLAELVGRVEAGVGALDVDEGPVPAADLGAPLAGPVAPIRRRFDGTMAPADDGGRRIDDESLSGDGSPVEGGPELGSAWVWRVAQPRGDAPGGPLDGWRLAVKDIIAVGGQPIRAGSRARDDARPQAHDAPVVTTLRDAGAVVVGATRLHEFAFGASGVNANGTPTNPAAPGRVPGGSSSGAAAAVAAGQADLSLGTDTGGSVRIPAALCGVVGFKPSLGAVSTDTTFPLSATLDHIGYLVTDTAALVAPARVLGLLPRHGDPPAAARLGVARGAFDAVDPMVADAVQAALDALGAAGIELVEVDWPGGEEVFAATTAIMFTEGARVHRHLLAARGDRYGADVRNRLVQGAAIGPATYLGARAARRRIRARCLATLAGVDAVLTPTVPIVAPTLDEAADPAVAGRLVAFTRLADLTGLPALSLPLADLSLPVGLQLEAADDATAIGAALSVSAVLIG